MVLQGPATVEAAEGAKAVDGEEKVPPSEAEAAAPNTRAGLCKYYFIVDLAKKTLVAVLTGGVLVTPLIQVGVLIAATSAQVFYYLFIFYLL